MISLPAFTGSGASVFETFSTGDDDTVVVAAAPATGAVSFEAIWYEPLVMTVPFASGLFTRTTSCTEDDTPVLSAPMVQLTMPAESAPPPVADTKVVLAGTASEITTPVAFSFPVFE